MLVLLSTLSLSYENIEIGFVDTALADLTNALGSRIPLGATKGTPNPYLFDIQSGA